MFNADSALLIIDVQNDFLPGGALAVPEGDAVISIINRLSQQFALVVATQDWHPQNHASFAANHPGKKVGQTIELQGLPQVLWPVHCVQHSRGAELSPALQTQRIRHIVQKGTDPTIDSYSGFFDNGHRRSTGLSLYLKDMKVQQLFLAGLATDYCVKFTALDAVEQGFKTTLVADACRGVDLAPGDSDRAIEAMRQAGVVIVDAADVLKQATTPARSG